MKKVRAVVALALIAVAVCVVAVMASDGAVVDELTPFATTITTLLAGTLGVWLVQGLKKILPEGIGDKLMTWISYGCAFVVALVAFAVTGGFKELFSSPWVVIQNLATTGGFMTLAYATLKGKLGIKGRKELGRK